MINLLGHCGRHRKIWTSTFRLSKTFQFSKPVYFLQIELIAAPTAVGVRSKSTLISSDGDEVAVVFPLESSGNFKAMHYHLSDDMASRAFDLLELTLIGVDDGKVVDCIESLARGLQDKSMRDLILLQAIDFVSRTHDDGRTDHFRRTVEKHNDGAKGDATVTSAATVWSDKYLRDLRSRATDRNSDMLERYLGKLSDSTAASDAWFRDVERARSRLVNVLGDKVVRTLLSHKNRDQNCVLASVCTSSLNIHNDDMIYSGQHRAFWIFPEWTEQQIIGRRHVMHHQRVGNHSYVDI